MSGWVFQLGEGPKVNLNQDVGIGSTMQLNNLTINETVIVSGTLEATTIVIGPSGSTGSFLGGVGGTNEQLIFNQSGASTGSNDMTYNGIVLSLGPTIVNSSAFLHKFYSLPFTLLNTGSMGAITFHFANSTYTGKVKALLCDLGALGDEVSTLMFDFNGGNCLGNIPSANITAANIVLYTSFASGGSSSISGWKPFIQTTPTTLTIQPNATPLANGMLVAINCELDALFSQSSLQMITIDGIIQKTFSY
jgi:hypothetical protein